MVLYKRKNTVRGKETGQQKQKSQKESPEDGGRGREPRVAAGPLGAAKGKKRNLP